ncbi:MAG: enoyl-CoA hydratase-related protein [Polyangiales bacterium]
MSELQCARVGATEIWTLARPERRNALSQGLVAALHDGARQAAARPETRAVLITGAGERAFCAGADLKERRTMAPAAVERFVADLGACFDAIDQLPKPVVAALNGAALGGGLELALACDFRLAADTAVLALPEVELGIIPGAGGTQRLPRLVGEARAKELILCTPRLSAAQALAWGLVQAVVPQADLQKRALAFCARFADGPALAYAAALRAIDAAWGQPLAGGLQAERAAYHTLLSTRDREEALQAFADKRPPRFRGA